MGGKKLHRLMYKKNTVALEKAKVTLKSAKLL